MAISSPHYRCLRELHRRGELPQGGSILEIGEANWYGDISFDVIFADIAAVHLGEYRRLLENALMAAMERRNLFDVAKVIYNTFFSTTRIVSIDMDGTSAAVKHDLNLPNNRNDWCNTVINHGTAEHIFNVAQVFRTMHDHCAVGGLMIHESPFTGWIDHGFWTIQPTTYYDLAAANGYTMVYLAITQIDADIAIPIESREQLLKMARANGIPCNAMLYVAMRKESDDEFKIPMQGVYAGTAGDEAVKAWHDLR